MKVMVNGEPLELEAPASISDVIAALEIRATRLAVELNRDIIPRSQHDSTLLQENDQLEIVVAIGGG